MLLARMPLDEPQTNHQSRRFYSSLLTYLLLTLLKDRLDGNARPCGSLSLGHVLDSACQNALLALKPMLTDLINLMK